MVLPSSTPSQAKYGKSLTLRERREPAAIVLTRKVEGVSGEAAFSGQKGG